MAQSVCSLSGTRPAGEMHHSARSLSWPNSLPALVGVLGLLLLSAPVLAGMSEVFLKSNPEGATVSEVTLGLLGTSNLTVPLKKKSVVELVFTKAGYADQRVVTKIKGRRMEVAVDLVPIAQSLLTVNMEPSHARFRLLDDRGEILFEGGSANANELNDSLWGGQLEREFEIEVSAPGYVTKRSRVSLHRQERRTLAYSLTGQVTVLDVASDPPGARVSEQSMGYLGTAPFRLKISLEDLIRHVLVLDPESGPTADLVLTYSKQGFATAVRTLRLDLTLATTETQAQLEPESGRDKP